ncbi:MAG: long-chain-fatty-acid--CoA ligase [Hyphomicrobiaceae bacterium]
MPVLLDQAVRRFGPRNALNFKGKTISYEDLGRQVDRLAAGLQRVGVRKGTKVGLFLPNTPAFVIYYYAILKAGGVVVNYNPLYSLEELSYQIKDSGTEMMVTHDLAALFSKPESLLASGTIKTLIVHPFTDQLPAAKALLFRLFKSKDRAFPSRSAAKARILDGAELAATREKMQPVVINPTEDVAVLQYTGGTTGTPKGAMLTHANLQANMQQVDVWAADLEVGQERILGALPLFHVFAMTAVMNLGIVKGAEIILMPRFQLQEAMELISKEKPTMLPAVPTIFTAMLHAPNLKSFDFSSLKFCISGGAALPLEVKLAFEKMAGCKVVEGYGLSVASPVITCNPIVGRVVAGSIGLPLPRTMVSLRDLDDPTKEVALGERGELCATGPQVMKGYWNRPQETEAQFIDGFLRTGDVATMDENGFFQIVDRIKDLIICSGFNVYPRRIEEAIYEHPAVEEVTVIGIKDSYRGEAPKEFIKLKTGMRATQADIFRHLEPKLSKIEMPSQIEFRESLPKTIIGKLSKKELVAEEAARSES